MIVGTEAVARSARRLLRIRPDRLRVVPLAAHPAFAPWSGDGPDVAAASERDHLGLPVRYLVYSGRYDARHDMATLPDDRAGLARAALRFDVGEALAYAPALPPARLAALVRGARAAILPAVSDAAGLPALDALAAGVPVVASGVGALPEIVGKAGIIVEPRDPDRLAEALRTAWADERVHRRLAGLALERAAGHQRSWADVAADTRRVYAEVGVRNAGPPAVVSSG